MAARLGRAVTMPCQWACECCDECMKCCEPCTECCSEFCDRPFAATLTFIVFIVGFPAFALFAIAGAAYGDNLTCDYNPNGVVDLRIWAFLMGACCIFDVGVAIYVFNRFSQPYDPSNNKDRNFSAVSNALHQIAPAHF